MPLNRTVTKAMRDNAANAILAALCKRYSIDTDTWGWRTLLAEALDIPPQEVTRACKSTSVTTLLTWAMEHDVVVAFHPNTGAAAEPTRITAPFKCATLGHE